MIDYNDLKYQHTDECKSKDSQNIKKENIICGQICDKIVEGEYEAYCKECGKFLYYFYYGTFETKKPEKQY